MNIVHRHGIDYKEECSSVSLSVTMWYNDAQKLISLVFHIHLHIHINIQLNPYILFKMFSFLYSCSFNTTGDSSQNFSSSCFEVAVVTCHTLYDTLHSQFYEKPLNMIEWLFQI